jgi:hypothetical protein
MALRKEITLDSGVKVDYHRVVFKQVNGSNEVELLVRSYKCEDDARQNCLHDREILHKFPQSELDDNSPKISQCYQKVKAALLSGAEDC